MTARHEEKGDETVAFRVPERIAAWLRDRARVLETTPSCLMRKIVEEFLAQTNDANISGGNPMFANIPDPHVIEHLDTLESALQAIRGQLGMVRADGVEKRTRRTA